MSNVCRVLIFIFPGAPYRQGTDFTVVTKSHIEQKRDSAARGRAGGTRQGFTLDVGKVLVVIWREEPPLIRVDYSHRCAEESPRRSRGQQTFSARFDPVIFHFA